MKYRAKRSFSVGFPGNDQEFKRYQVYDKIPKGYDADFEEVEGKKAAKKEETKEDK